jgi:hypothetical protein
MQSPVLLIVSHRPEMTAQVFQSIREASPPRLYIAGHGAGDSVDHETETARRVSEMATAVDWPCQVATHLSSHSVDRRHAVIAALNWFFACEPEGIVLQDDCLPHADFFHYCDWALTNYRDEPRIFHVSGDNLDAPSRLFGGRPIAFTPLAQVSGWASWANRWHYFEPNRFYTDTTAFERWPLSLSARWTQRDRAESLRQGLDAWDYQWQLAILNENGLCVSSPANLITKLGDREPAAQANRDITQLPAQLPDSGSLHSVPEINAPLTAWYERRMGLTSTKRFARILTKRCKAALDSRLERVAARLLFGWSQPIVVASTGRAASTLLFRSIVDGVIAQRFGGAWKRLPSLVSSYIHNRAGSFLARLDDIEQNPHRVLKTHDLYDARHAGKAKFIFVYGDPLESARSVAKMVDEHGRIWLEEHLFHLSAKGDYEDLFRCDLLNFGEQMRAWSRADPNDVFIVSFDELWDAIPAISAFVGFDINLPVRKPRAPKPSSPEIDEGIFSRLRNEAVSLIAAREHSKDGSNPPATLSTATLSPRGER